MRSPHRKPQEKLLGTLIGYCVKEKNRLLHWLRTLMVCSSLLDLEELDTEGELGVGGDGAAGGAGRAVGELG